MLCIDVRTCLSIHPPPVCRGWSCGLVFLPSLPSQIFFILLDVWSFAWRFRMVWPGTVGGTFARRYIFLQIEPRYDITGLFLIHICSSPHPTPHHSRLQLTKDLAWLNCPSEVSRWLRQTHCSVLCAEAVRRELNICDLKNCHGYTTLYVPTTFLLIFKGFPFIIIIFIMWNQYLPDNEEHNI